MNSLKTVFAELCGLFVEDVPFAVSIIAWIVVTSIFLPRTDLSGAIKGIILFAGLAAILVESAIRKSRVAR
ncbi:hypothetical protein [Paraburkholderia tropica]|jgi:hypothetical protein|uniref:hypothetical protein n=1 Tax=Paraburkholderia tropica TaxID=92647 RepID=UPI002AB188B3|nr:hypothetical protein [Paraburkholderia tropica]